MTSLLLALTVWTSVIPTARVHLRLDQHGGLAAGQLEGAVTELKEIWKAAGVHVTSGRYEDPVPLGATVVSLRVVEARASDASGNPALAWINLGSFSDAVPNLFVSVTGVRTFVTDASYRGKPLGQRPRRIIDTVIARAIGRVAAHELGHYLLRRVGHDREGLMRASYSVADLVADSPATFQLSDRAAIVARDELARLARK